MGRSRSRSPGRRDRRDRERDRERERERRHRRRSRSRSPKRHRSRSPRRRSRSPHRRRSRSRSRDKQPGHSKAKPMLVEKRKAFTEADFEGKDPEEIEMMKIMGFGNFETTKGKPIEGNDTNYGTAIVNKRKYRQYMNRKGGFNRPLDFIA